MIQMIQLLSRRMIHTVAHINLQSPYSADLTRHGAHPLPLSQYHRLQTPRDSKSKSLQLYGCTQFINTLVTNVGYSSQNQMVSVQYVSNSCPLDLYVLHKVSLNALHNFKFDRLKCSGRALHLQNDLRLEATDSGNRLNRYFPAGY
jgi:hypothetical protein